MCHFITLAMNQLEENILVTKNAMFFSFIFWRSSGYNQQPNQKQIPVDTQSTSQVLSEQYIHLTAPRINMHYRGEMRLQLILIVGFSVYCQLGCTSQLRVPSKEDMAHSWTNSGNRLTISLWKQGIQALPEDIFADFENMTVSFNQTHHITSKITKHAQVFYIFEVCYGLCKMQKTTTRISDWLNQRIPFDSIQYTTIICSFIACQNELHSDINYAILPRDKSIHPGSKLGWLPQFNWHGHMCIKIRLPENPFSNRLSVILIIYKYTKTLS